MKHSDDRIPDAVSGIPTPLLVLIHGSGDTSRVWHKTKQSLRHRSLAIDVLGRTGRPFDLTAVTLAQAARQCVADVDAEDASAPVVVVAHSLYGTITPHLCGLLGERVRHLVVIAGTLPAQGVAGVDVFPPALRARLEGQRAEMLKKHRGACYVRSEAVRELPADLHPVTDPKLVRAIESINLLFQPVDWSGVPSSLPRSFIRPTRDELHDADLQQRLIRASRADEVVDIESGHTPARDVPVLLAGLLDEIATRHAAALVPADRN